MKLWVTGDTHVIEGIYERLSYKGFPESRTMNEFEDNFVVILGDCGLFWDPERALKDIAKLNSWLDSKPFDLMFLMGNHENYDVLEWFPVSDFRGGEARFVSDHITVLETGSVFDFDGVKYGVFGGALSIDKYRRTEGKSWWSAEQADDSTKEKFMDALADNDWEIDYLLTHTCLREDVYFHIGFEDRHNNKEDQTTKFLSFIVEHFNLTYKQNYHGHFHHNMSLHHSRSTCLYKDIIPVGKAYNDTNKYDCGVLMEVNKCEES